MLLLGRTHATIHRCILGLSCCTRVDLQQNLEDDTLLHGQPVKLFQNGRDMLSPTSPGHWSKIKQTILSRRARIVRRN